MSLKGRKIFLRSKQRKGTGGYLHIGRSMTVACGDIIGIFDMDRTTISQVCRKYLSNMEKQCKIVNVTEELPRSFIVCMRNSEEKIYISQLSAATLLLRSKQEPTGF